MVVFSSAVCMRLPLQERLPLKMEDGERMQALLIGMNNIMTKKRPAYKFSKSMHQAVKRMVESARHNQVVAKRLQEFAKLKVEEKLLKISSSDVPEGILPKGYEGIIRDIKVSGHHADDKIYSNNSDIRQKIPRGTTLMELKKSSEEIIEDVLIYGNRKFTGDIGDEDDVDQPENDEWKKYFLKDQEDARQIVCMKKINGEAAHFSARKMDGKFYIITGSKNVHMIIKEKEDIDKYIGDRFSIAKVVARCVWDTLNGLEENSFKFLLEFLDLTKCTAICELLQPENQHIMKISHLKKPLLNVIGFTPPAGDEGFQSLVALPPHHTLDLLSSLGLTVPDYTTIQPENVQRYREEIRQGKHGYHEEGKVLYFLNEDEETIGLVKAKTVWYIMLRALREKVVYAFHTSRRRQQQNIDECINSCHRRFDEIKEWLLFSDFYLDEWKKLAKAFILWMAEEVNEENVAVDNIRPQYPVMWDKFLEDKSLTDYIELQYQDMHREDTINLNLQSRLCV